MGYLDRVPWKKDCVICRCWAQPSKRLYPPYFDAFSYQRDPYTPIYPPRLDRRFRRACSRSAPPKLRISQSTPILLLHFHSITFLSNSFTLCGDRAVPFLLFTPVPPLLTALSAQTARLQYHILAFSAPFVACVRLMVISTICH